MGPPPVASSVGLVKAVSKAVSRSSLKGETSLVQGESNEDWVTVWLSGKKVKLEEEEDTGR